jgi:23S rRNA pseudouridine955/2504/2580 synthase
MPVKNQEITEDENGLRLDRWFKRHYPGLNHGKLEKLLRTGQVRVDGGRIKANHRLETGNVIRVPPLPDEASQPLKDGAKIRTTERERKQIQESILFEDKDVLVINKPPGLAVQGGTGISRHLVGFLASIYEGQQAPKLVHRLDRETSGVLVLAKTDFAAAKLSAAFRERTTRKYYWALTHGVPKPKQGKISLALEKMPDGKVVTVSDAEVKARTAKPKVAKTRNVVERVREPEEERDDGKGIKSAMTLYQVIESAAKRVAFVAMWPLTGRTHQLRVHMQAIGTPIVGDELYAEDRTIDVDADVGMDKLHLHARRLVIPHPRNKGKIDVTAPLPPNFKKSWKFFEFPENDGDPFADYDA